MKKLLSVTAIAGMVAAASPALSGEHGKSGTMGLMPSGEWAKVMPDKELATKRGGFFSLAFSAMLTVYAENGGAGTGGNVTAQTGGGGGLPTGAQLGVQNGQVQVSAFVGNIQNVAGILSIVQVPGNYNVVNTQLTVQIQIINLLNASQIPTLSNLLLTR